MTFLSRQNRTPRLRPKDSNCVISWLEGNESYSSTATVGDYPNLGSLGDQTALRLGTDSSYIRKPMKGINGSAQWFNTSYLPHGLSTPETSLGESSAITLECWVKLISLGNVQYFIAKYYNTGGAPIASPYGILFRVESSNSFICYIATGPSSYVGVNAGVVPMTNEWVHFGLGWTSGSAMNFYMNGALKSSQGTYSILWGNHGRWAVGGQGGRTGLTGEGINSGAMQGVRIHDVERDASWFRDTYLMGVGAL
jgi:hypothetical protein